MGCSNSKSVDVAPDQKPRDSVLRTPQSNSRNSLPKSVAFDVKLDEDEKPQVSSNGKAKPPHKKSLPKRLQKLQEENASAFVTTAKELEEKHKKAEERRQQRIEEKLSKARASISLPSPKIPPSSPPPRPLMERTESRIGNHEEELTGYAQIDERTVSPIPEVASPPAGGRSESHHQPGSRNFNFNLKNSKQKST